MIGAMFRVAGAAIVVLATGFGPGPPAGAAGELEVSRDGVRWAPSYPGVLIDADTTLVPGRTVSGVVYIRNATTGVAHLGIAASNFVPGTVDGDHIYLDVTVTDHGEPGGVASHTLDGLAQAPQLDVQQEVEGGGVRRIDVTLRLDPAATNSAQQSRLGFDLVVQLSGDSIVIPGVPPAAPPVPSDSSLPATGAAITRVLLLAAALSAVGLWLRSASRRRA